MMKALLGNTIVFLLAPFKKLLAYLIPFPNFSIYKLSLVNRYKEYGIETSLIYAVNNFSNCLVVNKREHLWDYAISRLNDIENGLFVEFGTYKGYSINYFSSKLRDKKFYGFDSFEGLREDWRGWNLPKGSFNLEGRLPKVNSNVELIKGWFHETVPGFVSCHAERVMFLHVDCDTYESTKQILTLIGERFMKGTLIIFDEYIGFAGWQIGEFKAFQEYIKESGLSYKYLAFTNMQVLVEIT